MVNGERFYGLDFARSIFMLLGVFFHAALIYSSDYQWRVSSDLSSKYIEFIPQFTKLFRMESFYLLSGFFYAMLILKRRKRLVYKRVVLLGVPLVFVGMTLNSFMNYASDNYIYSDGLMYFINGDWLGHLWFIGNLIVYYILFFIPIKFLVFRFPNLNIKLLVLLIISTPFFAVINKLVVPDFSFLFIKFNHLFYYAPYFILGAFLFVRKDFFFHIISIRSSLILFSLFIFFYTFISFFISSHNIFKGLEYLLRILVVLSSIGFLNYLGSSGGGVIQRLSETNYSIYLLHQPLIVIIYVYFVSALDFGVYAQYSIICSLTILLAYFIHKFFVEGNRWGAFLLNGKFKT